MITTFCPTVADTVLPSTATPIVAPTPTVPVPTERPPPKMYSLSSAEAITPTESPAVSFAPLFTVALMLASDTNTGIVPASALPCAAAAARPTIMLVSLPSDPMITFPSVDFTSAEPMITDAVL